ncbi:unnamed protein product [Gongylonema pulchrum]|uniref:Parkin coregulated gene protein n=1 Tax=Gongylonema pulchrum TaxID=637853 RepID=A0A183EAU6_9BILA|nr:unnamed protein product [Gongylonema pulchrum]VDN41774.1 unnamed protein product [Gongylonema pulchrum]
MQKSIKKSITAGMSRPRSNSSPRRQSTVPDCSVPSYRNNFNEGLKGIEGILIKVILKPVVSKLMKKMSELLQPENMVCYQLKIVCLITTYMCS